LNADTEAEQWWPRLLPKGVCLECVSPGNFISSMFRVLMARKKEALFSLILSNCFFCHKCRLADDV
jgi:hypothetical protein